jgi:hypothetical protein
VLVLLGFPCIHRAALVPNIEEASADLSQETYSGKGEASLPGFEVFPISFLIRAGGEKRTYTTAGILFCASATASAGYS